MGGEDLTFGINQFTDMSQEEYRLAAGLGYKPAAKKWAGMPHLGEHTHNGEELALTVDWTTKGAVTPVKDQGLFFFQFEYFQNYQHNRNTHLPREDSDAPSLRSVGGARGLYNYPRSVRLLLGFLHNRLHGGCLADWHGQVGLS